MQKKITNRRTIIFALSTVLAMAGVASAETLYQWKEADGSLTFSPTPPPEGSGIEYRLMDTGGEPSADISLSEATLSASRIAQSQPATLRMLPRSNNVAMPQLAAGTAQVEPASVQGAEPSSPIVEYAPGTQLAMRNTMPQGISRAEPAAEDSHLAGNDNGGKSGAQKNTQPEVLVSRQKGAQCADLGKRIMALENRITLSKTAEQMDNAILHISRYQRSYNAHCD